MSVTLTDFLVEIALFLVKYAFLHQEKKNSVHFISNSATMCQNLNQAENVTLLSSLQKVHLVHTEII